MPTVDLTARLARDSRPGARDTILFDRTLPGFGLRIHPSGRKVWIVQARIAGRTRRLRIARHDEMEIAEVRRCAPHMKPWPQDRAHLSQGAHPARLRQDAARPHRTRGRRRVVRRRQQRPPRRGQPRLRNPALDDVPRRGMGPARPRHQPLPRHLEEPAHERRALPRHRRARTARPRPRRPRSAMARDRRRHPPARAHRVPPQRSARPPLARHRRRRHQAARLQDRSAPMQGSAGCGCTTCGTPWPARP